MTLSTSMTDMVRDTPRDVTAKGEYHDNLQALQADAAALGRERQQSLFDRAEWIELLHSLCLPRRKPLLLTARHEGAAAWLPLMAAGGGHYTALANWYNFTFRPIFSRRAGPEEREALLIAMARAACPRAAHIVLSPLPDEDGSASLCERAFRKAGWIVHRSRCDDNHILRVRGRSFADYWRARPGRLRSTVKRKAKKYDVEIRIEDEYSERAWCDYEAIYSLSWKPDEGSPEFLRKLARREGAAGTLRLGIAYYEGRPVAAQFWTVENGEALIHKLAHDESAREASPGTLLTAALFEHVIDLDKVALIDFGTGDDPYKRDWMEEVRPRYRLDLFRPERPAAWPALARSLVSKLAPARPND